jgi:hypothetical protein
LVIDAGWALAISWAIEFLQLTPIPAWMSSIHPLFHPVFGEVFNVTDLLWYAFGAAVAPLIEVVALAALARTRGGAQPPRDNVDSTAPCRL